MGRAPHAWLGCDAAGMTRTRSARPHMQVSCSKCSQPIALTDVIESHNGLLSHVDCQRPKVLTPEERALVFLYCSGHVVARCLPCDASFRYTELAADIVGGSRTNMC